MYCANCGTKNQKGDKNCVNCGSELHEPTMKSKIFGGGSEGFYCPNCRNSDYNENFCVKCGYNLNDVLGYYKINKKLGYQYYLEINRKYLVIHLKVSDLQAGDDWYKWPPLLNEKIENIEITECKGKIFSNPCLKLVYEEDFDCGHFSRLKFLCDGKNSLKMKLDKKDIPQIHSNIQENLKINNID
jgi:hypothetical protein